MEMETLLRDAMRRAVDKKQVAGVNLLVKKDGKEVCYLEEGLADVAERKPIRRDTIFRLYSQSKPVTAAAAMLLLERGQIDLCQQVSEFLPGFCGQTVADNGEKRIPMRGVTLQDLLNMTSGLCYPDPTIESGRQSAALFEEIDERLFGENPMTTREVADRLGQCVLDFAPGSRMRYGTSADVMGAVIEAVTGMPFGDFLKKEIFEPLGMEDTDFWVPEEKQERLARTYETVKTEEGCALSEYTGSHLGIMNRMERKPAFESGGAGLASTLDDYMRFADMLLGGGEVDGVRILRENTVRFMTTASLNPHVQEGFYDWFGLGGHTYSNFLRICKDPGKGQMLLREGEYGWDGWLGPYFANFPKENMTILMGMQKKDAGTWTLTRELRNIVLSRL